MLSAPGGGRKEGVGGNAWAGGNRRSSIGLVFENSETERASPDGD